MIDYTIMEYNTKTKKYTEIGYATGTTSRHAKWEFLKKTPWKPRLDVMLFAKIPVCR